MVANYANQEGWISLLGMEMNTYLHAALDSDDGETVRLRVRRVFSLLGGKWKLEILWLLLSRPHRFNELRRGIPKVTQHMLTAQLRELEADGLISRTAYPEVPPRVEYALSPNAQKLRPVFEALLAWAAADDSGAKD